mmetsp:Transcript_17049/g.66429  ORF Transcript_17049/g.66429 Transcript_17049/m.66429 type:complete len:273 (+) Transcript_17049:1784-2602(+)
MAKHGVVQQGELPGELERVHLEQEVHRSGPLLEAVLRQKRTRKVSRLGIYVKSCLRGCAHVLFGDRALDALLHELPDDLHVVKVPSHRLNHLVNERQHCYDQALVGQEVGFPELLQPLLDVAQRLLAQCPCDTPRSNRDNVAKVGRRAVEPHGDGLGKRSAPAVQHHVSSDKVGERQQEGVGEAAALEVWLAGEQRKVLEPCRHQLVLLEGQWRRAGSMRLQHGGLDEAIVEVLLYARATPWARGCSGRRILTRWRAKLREVLGGGEVASAT